MVRVIVVKAVCGEAVHLEGLVLLAVSKVDRLLPGLVWRVPVDKRLRQWPVELGLVEIGREVFDAVVVDVRMVEGFGLERLPRVGRLELDNLDTTYFLHFVVVFRYLVGTCTTISLLVGRLAVVSRYVVSITALMVFLIRVVVVVTVLASTMALSLTVVTRVPELEMGVIHA